MITQADVLDALKDALGAAPVYDEAAVTANELREATGLPIRRVHAEIRRLLREGRCERVRVLRERTDGIMHPEPGYRLR